MLHNTLYILIRFLVKYLKRIITIVQLHTQESTVGGGGCGGQDAAGNEVLAVEEERHELHTIAELLR